MMSSTLELAVAAARCWDAVVIGAGPAGSTAARELARSGAEVLLVDKATFPRDKVCGCCLGAAGANMLDAAGLGDLPARCGARPLRRFTLAAGRRSASMALPGGWALSRAALDAALVEAAIDAGADFIDHTHARLAGRDDAARCVQLSHAGDRVTTRTRCVIAADGLGGRLLDAEPGFERVTTPASRIGAACMLDDAAASVESGTIAMTCARHGYVGMVRLEDGRLNVAAAVDPKSMRRFHGPAEAVAAMLVEAGMPQPDGLSDAAWNGTGRLTQRRRRVAGPRLMVIGDAAGYVEPFTGEGITWAIACGQAVGRSPSPELWPRIHRRLLRNSHRRCRLVARLLRWPGLVRTGLILAAARPRLAAWAVLACTRPPHPAAPNTTTGAG